MARPTAKQIQARLGLEPLGFEGGFYRETHRSTDELSKDSLPERYSGARPAATAIFYMLTPSSCSLMHRLKTDEIYHFYLGDPVELLMLHPDGRHEVVKLGPDLEAGQQVQFNLPTGVWQGSRLISGGEYALMGTTMAPGFDLADFELGDREVLAAQYPEVGELLVALTPERLRTPRFELAAETLDLLHAELRSLEALCAGLSAEVGASGGVARRGEDEIRARLDALEADPSLRGRGDWYVVDRERRAWLGRAGYRGAPGSSDREVWSEVEAPEVIKALSAREA